MATKSRSTTKERARSKKKVGIAVYFTFIATFALCFGAQLWMVDVFNPKESPGPGNSQTYSVENTPTPQKREEQIYSTENPVRPERTILDNTNSENPDVNENIPTENNGVIDTYKDYTM